jgi:hypothetical protein
MQTVTPQRQQLFTNLHRITRQCDPSAVAEGMSRHVVGCVATAVTFVFRVQQSGNVT